MSTEDAEDLVVPEEDLGPDGAADEGYEEYEEDAGDYEGDEEPRSDPVQRWLLLIVGLIIAIFVAAGVSLVLYILSMRDAPRTSVERAINADEVAVRENPQEIENWARLALSYAGAERWTEATEALQRGRRIRKAAILDLTEADILRMKGDEACLAAYDRAIKSGQAEYDAQAKILRETKGVTVPVANPIVVAAMYGRAAALKEFGRTDEAIEAARKAAVADPSNADLHVLLGDMFREAGRNDEAAAEYRSALVYVPDLEAALEGLRALGEVK